MKLRLRTIRQVVLACCVYAATVLCVADASSVVDDLTKIYGSINVTLPQAVLAVRQQANNNGFTIAKVWDENGDIFVRFTSPDLRGLNYHLLLLSAGGELVDRDYGYGGGVLKFAGNPSKSLTDQKNEIAMLLYATFGKDYERANTNSGLEVPMLYLLRDQHKTTWVKYSLGGGGWAVSPSCDFE